MSDADTALAPRARLEALEDSGAEKYDPARFRFIDSMLQRATDHPAQCSRLLEDKALAALEVFQAGFEEAREAAQVNKDWIREHFPDSASDAQTLFDAGDFQQLRRLAGRLERACRRPDLAALTRRIAQGDGRADDESLDDLLRSQEEEIVRSYSQDDRSGSRNSPASGAAPELRSVRQFHGTMARLNAERLVRQTVGEAPADCGPLNPQMLAIRSLTAMSDLSPHYLSRFVSYIDTLFWLEQADEQTGK